ncbi:MAG: antibiotic biosynthesis monooxygenase [Bacteroidota bacterium]|nr:antibiotic biosynthesis monooxygenase [Bacteroidota bacterium]
MITRFVKMTFKQGKEEDFLKIFHASFEKIRSFKGCKYLELLEDVNQKNIFFTHSIWENEELLNSYRKSELFKKTWKATKALFSDKPCAWSLINKSNDE